MKNFKKLLLLIIVGTILSSTNVYAYVESITGVNKVIKNNEVNSKEYFLICSYAHQSKLASTEHTNGLWQRINIYYTYNNEWAVAWDNTSSNIGYSKKGNADKVFGTKGDNVFISDTDKNALIQKGECPELGYVDVSDWMGGNEICLGSKDYCKKQSKNAGAKEFAKGNTSSEKNYDILEVMDNFAVRWLPEDNWEWYEGLWGKSGVSATIALASIDKNKATKQCEKYKNEIKDNAGNTIRESIVKNFFNSDDGKNIPAFLEQKTQSIISTLNARLQNYSNYVCKAITNNDTTLTEEEKEKEKKDQEEAQDQIESDLEGVQEEVKSKIEAKIEVDFMDITTSDLDCDGIFAGAFGNALKRILNLIKFIVPILIVGLSSVDFVKAVASQDNSEIKKAANKMAKRIAIGLIIFLLPTLLELLLDIAGIEYGTCGIK